MPFSITYLSWFFLISKGELQLLGVGFFESIVAPLKARVVKYNTYYGIT